MASVIIRAAFSSCSSARRTSPASSEMTEARASVVSEDAGEVRLALEQLEKAARMITDAMFRPTGLASNPAENSEEEAVPLSDMS